MKQRMKGGSLPDRMESDYRSSVNTKYRYINMLNFLDFLRLSKVDFTFNMACNVPKVIVFLFSFQKIKPNLKDYQ